MQNLQKPTIAANMKFKRDRLAEDRMIAICIGNGEVRRSDGHGRKWNRKVKGA
jgi:hypothetical protein